MFASLPVFDEMDFKEKSGWYKPTVADVSYIKVLTTVNELYLSHLLRLLYIIK